MPHSLPRTLAACLCPPSHPHSVSLSLSHTHHTHFSRRWPCLFLFGFIWGVLLYLGKCRLQYVHPFQKHVLNRISFAFMSTKRETRGGGMGPIRGLELALSSDMAALGRSIHVCVCRWVVGWFNAGGYE